MNEEGGDGSGDEKRDVDALGFQLFHVLDKSQIDHEKSPAADAGFRRAPR